MKINTLVKNIFMLFDDKNHVSNNNDNHIKRQTLDWTESNGSNIQTKEPINERKGIPIN